METQVNDVAVKFTITRTIGADTITVDLSAYTHPDNYHTEMKRLQTLASDSVKDFVDLIAPTMPANIQPKTGDVKAGEFDAVEIFPVRTKKGDKIVYRVRGGSYTQHGVICFEDVLKQAGIDASAMPPKGWNMTGKGWVAAYSLRPDGTVDKIVRLYKREGSDNA